MSVLRLERGDCAEVMASMEPNSVDAIVTDPPYGLSFMGKEWDSFGTDTRQPGDEHYWVPDNPYGRSKARYGWNQDKSKLALSNRAFQEGMTYVFAEALRVAKPGAHLLCFGGTRTFHRMACAIEDAGWEIRDCIMWVYGCLDEETEVLVDGEFVPYNKAKKGRLALGYDIGTGNFSWQRIEDTYLYDYDDTAYAIQSDCTDQLVSRNHRCIVERGGVEQFALAELVALEREASVPVLESLHGLFDHLPLPDERAGGAQQDVLEGVRRKSRESGTEGAQGSRAEQDLSCVRKEVLRTASMAEEGKDELLLGELQEQGGVCSEIAGAQQGEPNANVRGTETGAQGANDWLAEPCMEGRRDVSQAPRGLREREVRSMPQGVRVDGSQGRVRDGASACCGEGDRQAARSGRGRASHQPRSAGQQTREPDAVPDEQGAQTLRSAWGAKTTLARVTPVHYEGKMWCIKVATGAFVARRHGKIFITGNSGFPKSMDVSKAIDKALGAEREKVPATGGLTNNRNLNDDGWSKIGQSNPTMDGPIPATAAAAEWDGWGTCLKPAWEPIIVARKPLDGTVAHNVLTWGVGALNIDACRVPTDEKIENHSRSAQAAISKGIYGNSSAQHTHQTNGQKLGRFPANLVHDGSDDVLALFPDSKGQQGKVAGNESSRTGDNGIYGHYGQRNEFVPRGDSGSAARFFYCAKANKKDRGEGNDHPTVKPTELMSWLVRLVTPQGGVVLDPFMGSGSTGVAAKREGMGFIGIERDEHYFDIASSRLESEPATLF